MAIKKKKSYSANKNPRAKIKRPIKAQKDTEQRNLNAEDMAFPIVGIGASAGGLNALEQFFKNMPSDSNMAFVIVAHLDPSHGTLLPELLQNHTHMPVKLAEDEAKVKPNNVYIIPPNKSMTIAQKTLYLFPKTEPYGSRLPIDAFMRSLAEDQGRNAVGIVLSGAGADGTMGLRAIKGEGGMTMAQDLTTAKYDGMPGSAIATGMVDYILAPDRMPRKLMTHAHNNVYFGPEKPVAGGREATAMRKIFVMLRANTGHDFSLYKQKTIWRRILRRMTACKVNDITAYSNYLEVNRQEVKNLFQELLIGVTNFFRDPEAFEALKQKILLPMMKDKPENYAFRIWVPGCASGEEVYSLAILFKECMEQLDKQFGVQFFGTDIDGEAIEIARNGIYPLSIASDVGSERLKSYFARVNSAYRIRKDIREMMIFALQDLIKDPPFIKMDLVSCRNVLIYMEQELQKRVIPIFHYAVKPDGALLLGYSESVSGQSDLFETIDKKWKIFKRIGRKTHLAGLEPYPAGAIFKHGERPEVRHEPIHAEKHDLVPTIKKALLDSFAPPCAIVDENDNVVYIHGRTGNYLEPADGAANLNIVEMAKPPIRGELVGALRQARLRRREISPKTVEISIDGASKYFNLIIRPIVESESAKGLLLIIFQPLSSQAAVPGKNKKITMAAGRKIDELEKELKYTRADLEITIEELQGANEELRSANEELQSSNEELQSSNEEMETSKEELQSLNEELVTVNTELQTKIDELARTNDDLKNFMDATAIPTIFIDTGFRVKRFTPKASQIVSLIDSDIGRLISDLNTNLVDVNLSEETRKVLETLVSREKEVRDRYGNYYQLRIVPYRTISNVIDGVVLTFFNTSEAKKNQQRAENAMNLAKNVVETVKDPLMVLDTDMKVVSANRAFHENFKTNETDIEGRPFYVIGDNSWNTQELRDILEKVIPTQSTVENYPLKVKTITRGERQMLLNAREVRQGDGQAKMILLAFRDLTETNSDEK